MSTQPSLRAHLDDYLALRRALGFKLHNAGRLLGQFVDYLDEHGLHTPTIDSALAWATLPTGASTSWRAIRLSAVRGFAAYLHSIDPRVEVPAAGLIHHGPDRATPYLYSDEEIRALLQEAAALRPALRAATYQTLIGLLAASGLRVGEAIALDSTDLDTEHELLVVRHTKFDKSRLVPLHPSTMGALRRYTGLRDQAHPRPACPALLVSTTGARLLHSNIGLTFTRLARQAGIVRRSAACRPRIHDLRHSFAVATVLDWYRDGADAAAMMPKLSTYLGHTDPKHTYWYLSAAPELMALAGRRLDAHLAGQP
ncbi:tyrosine-type recombinase/integrase [Streptomyces albogriseolus]|uniref:tyrosine-type recombinase/integrase n=1 Tax=Streptomyces albogriseolus TaxID=1887 RepID=UPI0019A21B1D|nr:tyrosine-type recombinase/integrase [Streptomyces sp.]